MKLSTKVFLLLAAFSLSLHRCADAVTIVGSRLVDNALYREDRFQVEEVEVPLVMDEHMEEVLYPRKQDELEIPPVMDEHMEEILYPRKQEELEIPPVMDEHMEEVLYPRKQEEEQVPPVMDEHMEEVLYPRNRYVDVLGETRANECSVTVRGGMPSISPILLKTDSAESYPFSSTGVIQVNAGQTMQLWCPSQFKLIAETLVTATCVSGTSFRINGNTYNFNELDCKSWPTVTAKRTGTACNGGTIISVGFAVSSTRFVEEMSICFDEDEEVTRYVHHTLEPGSNYYQTGVDRVTFQTAGYFGGKNVDKLYTQVSQQETINNELGYDANQYFDTKSIFLARGHMAAKADYVYAPQQRGTFLFINVAPQWQSFNAGNWARVEDGVRAFVSKNKMNVDCYTGVYGVTTLPNKDGTATPLYLSYDNNHNGLIPVPKLYFRVVIEPSTKKGIVLIGVNNPHLTLAEIQKDYILCPDVSDKVTYVNWKKTDITTGYSYACEVAEFTKVVKNLPALSAPGGLLV